MAINKLLKKKKNKTMKKAVNNAKIIFWLSFTVLIYHASNRIAWILLILIVCTVIIHWGSTPNPILRRGRLYQLIAIVPQKSGYSIVLSFEDNIETYTCKELNSNFDPVIGNKYLVEIEDEIVYFTS